MCTGTGCHCNHWAKWLDARQRRQPLRRTIHHGRHRTRVNGPSEFRREHICTAVAGWKAFGGARNAAKSGLIFEKMDERDARNDIRAYRYRERQNLVNVHAACRARMIGRCRRPSKQSISTTIGSPGLPSMSTSGRAQDELRGQRSRGSNRGCSLAAGRAK